MSLLNTWSGKHFSDLPDGSQYSGNATRLISVAGIPRFICLPLAQVIGEKSRSKFAKPTVAEAAAWFFPGIRLIPRTAGIKPGAGDGIAVSWVKKRRTRAMENVRPRDRDKGRGLRRVARFTLLCLPRWTSFDYIDTLSCTRPTSARCGVLRVITSCRIDQTSSSPIPSSENLAWKIGTRMFEKKEERRSGKSYDWGLTDFNI